MFRIGVFDVCGCWNVVLCSVWVMCDDYVWNDCGVCVVCVLVGVWLIDLNG